MLLATRNAAFMVLALLLVAACASGPRTEPAGVIEVGKFRVTIDDGWYRVPGDETPEKDSLTRVLTREGADKDRLYIIASVERGETLFKPERAAGAPAFDPGMSPEDVADMVAESLNAAIWGGTAEVDTVNVREHGYTGIPGVQLELEISGPVNHRGLAGAFAVDERLYAVIFVAESPDSFERFEATALQSINSALYSIKTIRRN